MPSPERPEDDDQWDARRRGSSKDRSGPGDDDRSRGARGPSRSPRERDGDRSDRGPSQRRSGPGQGDRRPGPGRGDDRGRSRGDGRGPSRGDERGRSRGDDRGRSDDRERGPSQDRGARARGGRDDRRSRDDGRSRDDRGWSRSDGDDRGRGRSDRAPRSRDGSRQGGYQGSARGRGGSSHDGERGGSNNRGGNNYRDRGPRDGERDGSNNRSRGNYRDRSSRDGERSGSNNRGGSSYRDRGPRDGERDGSNNRSRGNDRDRSSRDGERDGANDRGGSKYRDRSSRDGERGGSDNRGRGNYRDRNDKRDGRDNWDRGPRRERSFEPEEAEPTNRFDDGTGGERRTGPKKWGGVARRGAYHLGAREEDTSPTFSPEEQAAYEERVARRSAEIDRREGLRRQAADAITRAESGPPKPPKRAANKKSFERQPLPARSPEVDLAVTLNRVLGDTEGVKAYRKVKRAATAFEEGRYDDARQILKPLVDAAPGVADIREIYGLTLYRMERWRQAADQLEQFRVLAGSAEQNAVLADSYRAQQRWADVDALWEELRDQSPSGAAVNEGRVVVAGSLADRGMLKEAIALLEQGWTRPKRPREDHLSRAYALADLYDRAGEATVARELFGWVAGHDPMFSDAGERMRS